MKSEETIYQNEETQLEQESITVEENTENTKKKNNAWKRITIGGVSGILLGGASVYATNALTSDGEIEELEGGTNTTTTSSTNTETPVSEDTNITVDDTIQVATVSDDASFGEAFADARSQVGAGGIFEWHGNVYSTHYAEEWDSMSPEEQAEFGNHINYNGNSTSDVVAEVEVEVETEETPIEVVAEPEPSPEIEVLAVEDGYNVQVIGVSDEVLDDGSTITIGQVQVEDNALFYIDANHDGVFDLAVADVNHDGNFSEDEYIDISQANITVNSLDATYGMSQDEYLASNDAPDYIGEDCNLV